MKCALLYNCDNDNASSHKFFFGIDFSLYLFGTVLIELVLNFSDYSEVSSDHLEDQKPNHQYAHNCDSSYNE